MKWANFFILIYFLSIPCLFGQNSFITRDYTLLEYRLNSEIGHFAINANDDENNEVSEFPSPKSVMFKSMIIPGWGQIVNRQIWKVPIVYGLFAGVGVYTMHLNEQYNDYKAAYYNVVQGDESDFRFGPTPEYLQGVNSSQLQSNRNNLRNQRDFMFVVMGLAYGLNVLDAYVFAHMRSFDVSDDLSFAPNIQPAILDEGTPGVRVSISMFRK